MTEELPDDYVDQEVDEIIRDCLSLETPKSFFLYAGAGSGKTRSLVDAVKFVCNTQGRKLLISGKKIGVITFTNAARDEIAGRLDFDPRVEVSTIHSFAWTLIGGHNADIRNWLEKNLTAEIDQLIDEQKRGRAKSKAATDRARSIEAKTLRRAALKQIRRFVYSPTGDNRTKDALNHAEVLSMTAEFLNSKVGLQQILVSKYPILLIDESQDTNRQLMDAFISVQQKFEPKFCLGLFGDTMQRIYLDGKVGLAQAIPTSWAKPTKKMNHRSGSRIIRLINQIRSEEDNQQQQGRKDKPDGIVRLFLVPHNYANKIGAESSIAALMAELTGDGSWKAGTAAVKTLTLEHQMAARRFGFDQLFAPLYRVDRLKTGLLDGTLPGLSFFTQLIAPTVQAVRENSQFALMRIVKSSSPILERDRLRDAGKRQGDLLQQAKKACDRLAELFRTSNDPSLLAVLQNVAETGLYLIPDSLVPFSKAARADGENTMIDDEEAKTEVVGWRAALDTPFSQIEKYAEYVSGRSTFDTHQGVKGRQYPRVMVVLSDEESRGFLFSYDKLFGAKEKSKTDLDNEKEGRETAIQRTRRLFYVTCSRAQDSLAVVYYTDRPELARKRAVESNWFDATEVELFDPDRRHS